MNKKFGIKEVVAIGIGTALFVVLTEVQIVSNAAAWILVAPVLDIAVYAEPASKVFLQGAFAFLGNIIIIGILGSLLLAGYSRVAGKSSSLKKED